MLLSYGYYFKTFHFHYVMSHWHLLYFGCFVVFTWCSMPVPIFYGLFCSLLYLICAYHDHGRLSYWKLFINLCYSVFYCTFTILTQLPHFFTSVLLMVLFGADLTYVCNCVWYLWFTLISESNQVDICPLWCYFWFYAVCIFSCRCLVNPLRAKTL